MHKLHLMIGLMLVVGTGAIAPVAAEDIATVEADGSCNYDGAGGESSGGADVDDTSQDVLLPSEDAAADGASACADAASNGALPGGGSHMAAGASVADGVVAANASSVPVSNYVTGQGGDLNTGAAGSGACFYDGSGGSDSATVFVREGNRDIHRPEDPIGHSSAAGVACGMALANGELPDGGSHLRLHGSAVDGAASVTVDTVPGSNMLP